jgi:hypothetical protein
MKVRKQYRKRKLGKSWPEAERLLQSISYWDEKSVLIPFTLTSNGWGIDIDLSYKYSQE